MYCVIQINLTQKTSRVVCTGLYGSEAKAIANNRNNQSSYYEMKKPAYELIHKYRPDKIRYIMSHERSVENAVRNFFEEYNK